MKIDLKTILLLGGAGVGAYLLYTWWQKQKLQQVLATPTDVGASQPTPFFPAPQAPPAMPVDAAAAPVAHSNVPVLTTAMPMVMLVNPRARSV